jgi:anti-anti-sigma factor
MELKLSHEDGYVLAESTGPIDDSAEALFREYMHPLVGQRGTKVVLDLSKTNMITSKGIGQLVTLVANANTNGSRIILTACTPFVLMVLERCKLNKYFDMADSVSAAVSALLG